MHSDTIHISPDIIFIPLISSGIKSKTLVTHSFCLPDLGKNCRVGFGNNILFQTRDVVKGTLYLARNESSPCFGQVLITLSHPPPESSNTLWHFCLSAFHISSLGLGSYAKLHLPPRQISACSISLLFFLLLAQVMDTLSWANNWARFTRANFGPRQH